NQEDKNPQQSVEEAAEKIVNEAAEEMAAEQKKQEETGRRARKKRMERHVDELNEKVEQMGLKLAEMNDKYMRVYSEYENYRKRTSAEKASLILNGGKDVIKLMLPVLDDMERALANLAEGDTAREGMELIYKNMMNALQQKGLKPMEAKGVKFDENFHEAITQIPAPTPEAKGTVLDVVKKGYFLNDDVIRFAQVVVAC
ncbi:MAG: nucleotide exchange factor GrpE, partial [Bacteroidales bacterium]|nr:nucleotide exchange factor GrpE [Bacteroidales bacterium]